MLHDFSEFAQVELLLDSTQKRLLLFTKASIHSLELQSKSPITSTNLPFDVTSKLPFAYGNGVLAVLTRTGVSMCFLQDGLVKAVDSMR